MIETTRFSRVIAKKSENYLSLADTIHDEKMGEAMGGGGKYHFLPVINDDMRVARSIIKDWIDGKENYDKTIFDSYIHLKIALAREIFNKGYTDRDLYNKYFEAQQRYLDIETGPDMEWVDFFVASFYQIVSNERFGLIDRETALFDLAVLFISGWNLSKNVEVRFITAEDFIPELKTSTCIKQMSADYKRSLTKSEK